MNALLLCLVLIGLAAAQDQIAAIDGGASPNQYLYLFGTKQNPAPITSRVYITGLAAGDRLLALATFPSTTTGNNIFGISQSNSVYRLNTANAVATFVSNLTCDLSKNNPTLSTDFNPNTGLLTILTLVVGGTATDTNLYTANATTGACTAQTPAQFASDSGRPVIKPAGIFYRFNGVNTTPTLFIIETASQTLSTVPPTGGALSVVGPLTTGFLSGVGGSALTYGNPDMGISVLYNSTFNSSAIYSINLSDGSTVNTANLTLFTNLLGLAVANNPFPQGVVGIGSGTGSGNNTGGNTGGNSGNNNGNIGNIVITSPTLTATATISRTDTGTFSTSADAVGTNGALPAQSVTVIPPGAGTFTKTVSVAIQNTPLTQIQVATVSENGIEEFSGTAVVNFAGPTITAAATVQLPAGQVTGSATYVYRDGNGATSTRSAVVAVGGVDKVTLPVFTVTNLAGARQTAVVTVGDNNGQTATQVATVNLDSSRLGQFVGSASSIQASMIALVAVLVVLF